MSRWFRHYAGMVRDEKLVRIAIRTKQPIERVLWVWGAILESASEIDDNGRYDMDEAEVAYFLRADEDDIRIITAALGDAGHLAANTVARWGDRQFLSDKSKDRQAAYRERKRASAHRSDGYISTGDVTETSRDGAVTAQETETETETEDTLCRVSPPLTPPRRKAVRLSADWTLPTDWHDWADSEFPHWPPGMIERQAAQMRDWSLSSPKGAKLDWFAAWRGWCRREDGKKPHERTHHIPDDAHIAAGRRILAEDRRRGMGSGFGPADDAANGESPLARIAGPGAGGFGSL